MNYIGLLILFFTISLLGFGKNSEDIDIVLKKDVKIVVGHVIEQHFDNFKITKNGQEIKLEKKMVKEFITNVSGNGKLVFTIDGKDYNKEFELINPYTFDFIEHKGKNYFGIKRYDISIGDESPIIPSYYDNNKIEIIDEYAFGVIEPPVVDYYDEDGNMLPKDDEIEPLKLTSVIIPEGIKFIGKYAFANNSIEEITLPNSLLEIGSYAFSKNYIKSVIIPYSIEFIGERAFRYNQIKKLSIPPSLKTVNQGVFESNHIKSLIIPKTVEMIKENAFYANKLEELKIDMDNGKIIRGAFYYNPGLFGKTIIINKKVNIEMFTFNDEVIIKKN